MVLRETWHSFWIALNDSDKPFSLQNCKMILMTLRGLVRRRCQDDNRMI